ncbi:MAG: DUF1552 domain-containing protein [Myxococcales bacterium]|nr:DUF1552 domain-containing protein [Myxococcales bacterium]
MNKKHRMSRRHLLRGAGTVAIALPFLEEMAVGSARAATSPPGRLITAFFGLGLHPDWQKDFSGPLEPYKALAPKMALVSVELTQTGASGAHCETSALVFVGERQKSVNIAGGASIDQLVKNTVDPTAKTLTSGIWWRRGACDAQANRVYNADGTPRPPTKHPSKVFDAVFGNLTTPGMGMDLTDAERRTMRSRRSVLDTVMDQYKTLTGDRSPLGKSSQQKVEQHLASIREVEQQLAPVENEMGGVGSSTCTVSGKPTDPSSPDYDKFTYGTGSGSPAMDWKDFQNAYRLHADLYALALRCDVVRFGNLAFESAGGHTNLSGTYNAMGDSTDFPGTSQHDSYFHDNKLKEARLYQHFCQSNLAYFLAQLDDPDHLEANGKTVLDNSCIVIGTEYGWNHSKNQAFHAVAGGYGKFKSGNFTDRRMDCSDFYNAIVSTFGLPGNIGQSTGVDSQGDATVILK